MFAYIEYMGSGVRLYIQICVCNHFWSNSRLRNYEISSHELWKGWTFANHTLRGWIFKVIVYLIQTLISFPLAKYSVNREDLNVIGQEDLIIYNTCFFLNWIFYWQIWNEITLIIETLIGSSRLFFSKL